MKIPTGPKGIEINKVKVEVVEKALDGSFVSVPLTDAYIHHYVLGSMHDNNDYLKDSYVAMKNKKLKYAVGFAAGTESRGSIYDFPEPYAFVTQPFEDTLYANIHIINTRNFSADDAHKCLECPCTSANHKNFLLHTLNGHWFPSCGPVLQRERNNVCSLWSYNGGLQCCEHASYCLETDYLKKHFNIKQKATYYLKVELEYTELREETKQLYLASCCDATGDMSFKGNIEYDIPRCDNENKSECIHTLETTQKLGGAVSWPFSESVEHSPHREVEIVYAVAHQHRGGLGFEAFNEKTGELICESKPVYGTGEKVGNENGYVVSMTPCIFKTGLKMNTNDVIRVKAYYNSSVSHTGVMSLLYIAIADKKASQAGKEFQKLKTLNNGLPIMDREIQFSNKRPHAHVLHIYHQPPSIRSWLNYDCLKHLFFGCLIPFVIVSLVYKFRKPNSIQYSFISPTEKL